MNITREIKISSGFGTLIMENYFSLLINPIGKNCIEGNHPEYFPNKVFCYSRDVTVTFIQAAAASPL